MITNSILCLDARFTLSQEFCGHPTAQYVFRFCGKFIASFGDKGQAEKAAVIWNEQRVGE